MMIEAAILAVVLTIISYFAEHFARLTERIHGKLVSVSAGILAATIFLLLWPILQQGFLTLDIALYLALLLGFLGYHVGEEWLYQHGGPSVRKRDLREWHAAGYFLDHFILGFALALLIVLGQTEAVWLAAIPFIIYTAVSSHSAVHLRKQLKLKAAGELALSLGPLVGVIVGYLIAADLVTTYAILGYITGSLIYMVARDLIPKDREAHPWFFALGAIVTAAFLAFA
jgi:hypothetical protein